jgi:hypothetical protein
MRKIMDNAMNSTPVPMPLAPKAVKDKVNEVGPIVASVAAPEAAPFIAMAQGLREKMNTQGSREKSQKPQKTKLELPSGNNSASALFLVALIIYIVDIIFRTGLSYGESTTPGMTWVIFSLYLGLSVWAAVALVPDDADTRTRVGALLFFIFVPTVLATFSPDIANWIYARLPNVASYLVFLLIVATLNQAWLWYLFGTQGKKIGRFFYWLFVIYMITLILAAPPGSRRSSAACSSRTARA